MECFCSQQIGYKETKEDGKMYDLCGMVATHSVKDSDWYLCEEHTKYYLSRGYTLEKLEGA